MICFFVCSGLASDWTELVSHCIRNSRRAQQYVAEEVLFKHPNRFQEYLIDCSSAEVKHSNILFRRKKKTTLLFNRFVMHSVAYLSFLQQLFVMMNKILNDQQVK